ncbi:TetR/AcrR family transcriptional regulator [Glaciibacter superstes]|uniref:TetR/AcrR family transcriptional regulator n=1 Tax=Glaciibacter superstes TaxID=501023 RepID=UPI00146BCD1A|nr:TetR family transcriptional regulator [Glaciibacter superstes]
MTSLQSTRTDVSRNHRMLLDAAASALAENPEASMADVAAAAGLTRATLYRHFGSREKLLGALRADALASAREAIAGSGLEEGSAIDSLHRVISAITALGDRFWPLLANGAEQDPSFVRDRAEAFSAVHSVILRGQDDGLIRPELSPQWLVAALTALLAASVRSNGGARNKEAAAEVFDLLAFGVVNRDDEDLAIRGTIPPGV